MSVLPTIDLSLLSRASGGNGEGANRTVIEGDIKVKTPLGIEASGKGSYQSSETNYARCVGLAAANGAKPVEFPSICGMPPAATK
ncbi:MAG: hypothetical protein IPI49_21240 [Myxococcales bacterium]|jgi:hypothetical protein|nr:hypothetical protein [Myxococcales bacterium]HRC55056.1 hypothetical protein [Kofleriaceae bacterium]